MIIVGWLDGLIGRRRSIVLSYAISLVGIGALWLLAYAPSILMLGMFIVCFGGMLGSRGRHLYNRTQDVPRPTKHDDLRYDHYW